jgi:hypothetical protein
MSEFATKTMPTDQHDESGDKHNIANQQQDTQHGWLEGSQRSEIHSIDATCCHGRIAYKEGIGIAKAGAFNMI